MYLIVYIQRSKQCQRCGRYATDFNTLIAMYVEYVEDCVLQFLCNTAYRVTHFVTHVEGVKGVKYYE